MRRVAGDEVVANLRIRHAFHIYACSAVAAVRRSGGVRAQVVVLNDLGICRLHDDAVPGKAIDGESSHMAVCGSHRQPVRRVSRVCAIQLDLYRSDGCARLTKAVDEDRFRDRRQSGCRLNRVGTVAAYSEGDDTAGARVHLHDCGPQRAIAVSVITVTVGCIVIRAVSG